MIDDPVLLNDWYIVAAARELADEAMLSVRLWDEELVIWRHDGRVMAWKDYCIHRGAKLSLGRIADGTVECPYHGWSFDGGGQCQRVPQALQNTQPNNRRSRCASLPTATGQGLLFVWMG
ncbi:MAG: Rieske 2Fe-2S domain-containing protein, partial [Pseudomonadota bacterium]|nr:Rieske 2Fe-2S domain-containing protein [Pseudomonadota bacterium]